ncbi:MAG: hypothetical protein JWL89_306 [Candidatus Saccharibacteria bacterium]|nr:hypothetical protein [Candidatus Saccharibacteria bacterium]
MSIHQNMVAEHPRQALPYVFEPKLVEINFSHAMAEVIDVCEQELSQRANQEPHSCWGYFPDGDEGAIERNLPASKALQNACPVIEVGEQELAFSWIRFSGSDTSTERPSYHLDADAQTGLLNERLGESVIPSKNIWRLLVNLHRSASRKFAYLDISADSLQWQKDRGIIGLSAGEQLNTREQKVVDIPRRLGGYAMGVLVCVSQVPHAGKETGDGHFLASWSLEEVAA